MPLLVVELRHLSGFSPQGVRAFDADMTHLRPEKLQISNRAEPRLWGGGVTPSAASLSGANVNGIGPGAVAVMEIAAERQSATAPLFLTGEDRPNLYSAPYCNATRLRVP